MTVDPQRNLGAVAAFGAVALVAAVLVSQIFGSASGPEAAIITHLKQLERKGLVVPLAFGQLQARKLDFQRISVVLDADAQGALVTSTLDFTGQVARADGVTQVSSLGLERARYVLRDGDWVPAEGELPRLRAILGTLERRRGSLERGEPLADGGVPFGPLTRRRYSSEAWFIRSERGEVLVSEDARLQGDAPDRPVDERSTTRLTLVEDDAGLFSFPGGIL